MMEGKGARLTDHTGKVYLDGLAGLWCVNVGYGRDEIAEAIYEQAKKLPYYHQFAAMGTEPGIHTADKVKRMAPGTMARVLFGCSGSDANDTQVKIAWYYNNLKGRPQKKKILARNRAYHGVTVAAGSLTGLPTCTPRSICRCRRWCVSPARTITTSSNPVRARPRSPTASLPS